MWSLNWTGDGEAERVEALFASANFWAMLGVQPALGRLFTDERAINEVVLSDAFWRRRFHADPAIVGKSIRLDGTMVVVAGVLPADFHWHGKISGSQNSNVDIWLPINANPLVRGQRSTRLFFVTGRLAAGVAPDAAEAEVRTIWARLERSFPESNSGFTMRLRPLIEQSIGGSRTPLLALLAMFGLVLLASCASVANLLLVRLQARRKEIAVRLALGASRGRIAAQMFIESAVLVTLAAIGGSALAYGAFGAFGAIVAAVPKSLPRRSDFALDTTTLLFAIAIAALTALLCGLAPVWQSTRTQVHDSLKSGTRAFTRGKATVWLVGAEAAMAAVLVFGAGLLAASFARVLRVDPGFRTDAVFTLSTQAPVTARERSQRQDFFDRARAKLEAIPGVTSAAAVSRLPLLGQHIGSWMFIEGRVMPPGERLEISYRVASHNYFEALRIPLRGGRFFSGRDPLEVLINETTARKFFPNEDPVGKRVRFGPNPGADPWGTVVGVVGDIRHFGLDVAAPPEIYRPYEVNPLGSPVFVVATDGAVRMETMRAALREVSPEIPIFNMYAMNDLVVRTTEHRRFPMLLLAGFAVLTLLLAAIGLYGVIAQDAAQRRREFGVRMSLGATPGHVFGLLLRQGLRIAAAGLFVGVLIAAGVARYTKSLLFATEVSEPLVWALGCLALLGVAAAACVAPGLRAARSDPAEALRSE